MKRLPIRQVDKQLMQRWFRQTYPETRRGTIQSRRLNGTYTTALNGTVVGNVTSTRGDFDAGTNVMITSYEGRTRDFIAGPAPIEDSSTQAGAGFTLDVSNSASLL